MADFVWRYTYFPDISQLWKVTVQYYTFWNGSWIPSFRHKKTPQNLDETGLSTFRLLRPSSVANLTSLWGGRTTKTQKQRKTMVSNKSLMTSHPVQRKKWPKTLKLFRTLKTASSRDNGILFSLGKVSTFVGNNSIFFRWFIKAFSTSGVVW